MADESWSRMMAANFGDPGFRDDAPEPAAVVNPAEADLADARKTLRAPTATQGEIAAAAAILAHSPHPDDRLAGRTILDNLQT